MALLLSKQPEATAIAHYEGAQFAVVLAAEPQAALAIAETLRASGSALNLTYASSQGSGDRVCSPLTLSLGVACWQPPAPLAPEDLLAAATSALRAAQQQGGNCAALGRLPDGTTNTLEV